MWYLDDGLGIGQDVESCCYEFLPDIDSAKDADRAKGELFGRHTSTNKECVLPGHVAPFFKAEGRRG